MRPTSQTLSATGSTAPVIADYFTAPMEVTVALNFTATGTPSATVEYSLDDPWASYTTSYTANAMWLTATTALAADGRVIIQYPVRATRVTATEMGGGTLVVTTLQSGPT